MGLLKQLIKADEGYHAVIVDGKSHKPEFHQVVAWGLMEQEQPLPDGRGLDVWQAVVPLVVCPNPACPSLEIAVHIPGFLGIAKPGDKVTKWNGLAAEWVKEQKPDAKTTAEAEDAFASASSGTWH